MIEDVDRRRLTFEVSYPLTERDSDFKRGKLIFELCSRYLVAEGHITGQSVIRSAEIVEVAPWGVLIRIHTDHGVREVSCYSITEESPFAEPTAAPNGSPATQPGNSSVSEGPPSVS